ALHTRDGGCSFPGCPTAPEWTERHHVIPWIDGGETNLDNLTSLCRHHHHNFATRGWTCRINADGLPDWRPPKSVDSNQKPMINSRITALHAARLHRRN
ncbi:MAG TPA: HNH endonuclease signature motif containing protein, partial [Propionibacteriaceae bacterium]|nr:HNH endonuclease signature motif containing protein [Propionibacteriaceae bacterium]